MMTGKKYIDFFPLDAEREVELSAGKCPRCEQSTARPLCGVRPHGAVRGAVPRDPLGPRASPPRAPDGRHRDISSAARAAPPAPRPLPPALSAPRRPSPPPQPLPVRGSHAPPALTQQRAQQQRARRQRAHPGAQQVPGHGGGTRSEGGGGAQVGTAPQVGAGIVGRGVFAPPPNYLPSHPIRPYN